MPLTSSFSKTQEAPFRYSASPGEKPVFEVSLRTRESPNSLKDLWTTQRLVQVLSQGEILGEYAIYDFLIWPEGLFIRVSLGEFLSLSEFLKFLKEKSSPTDNVGAFWEEALQWVRIVPPERIAESTRLFLETADRLRRDTSRSFGFSPSLFFFYRNPQLSR